MRYSQLRGPPATADLAPRLDLLASLDPYRDQLRPLVSAPAGYGGATLVRHWVDTLDGATARFSTSTRSKGGDRFAEQFTNDFNLIDTRMMCKVWAAYTFPSPHFQLVFGYEHRSRRGELLDVVDHAEENRYTGSLKFLF